MVACGVHCVHVIVARVASCEGRNQAGTAAKAADNTPG